MGEAHLINSAQGLGAEDLIKQLYITDGFYPEYTQQNKKILFIGKEGLELGGNDYIEKLFTAYQTKFIGETYPRPINSYQFHSTMLYIAYAVNYKVYN